MTTKTECRVCLKGEANIPIFGGDDKPDISLEVKIFGNIQLQKEDEFPKVLCQACLELLENAISFRKSALHADALLKLRTQQRGSSNRFLIVEANNHNKISITGNVLKPDEPKTIAKSETARENIIQVTDSNPELEYLTEYLDNIVWLEDGESKQTENVDQLKTEVDNFESTDNQNISSFSVIQKTHGIPHTENPTLQIMAEKVVENSGSDSQKQIKNQQKPVEVVNNVQRKECPVCKKMILPYYWDRHQKLVHGIEVIKCDKSPAQKDLFCKKECPVCKKKLLPCNWAGHLIAVHNLDVDKSVMVTPVKESSQICDDFLTIEPAINEEIHNQCNNAEITLSNQIHSECVKDDKDQRHYITQENHQKNNNDMDVVYNEKDPTGKKQCPICHKLYKSNNLAHHQKLAHSIDINECEEPLICRKQCPECKELLLPQHWTRHLKAKHGIHTQYLPPPPILGAQQKSADMDVVYNEKDPTGKKECPVCHKPFTSNNLVHHQKLVHKIDIEECEKPLICRKQCPQCKELLLPQHWTRHLKAKHGIHTQYLPPPPPPVLGDQQKSADMNVVYNEKDPTGKKECPVCHKPFTSNNLAHHQKLVHRIDINDECENPLICRKQCPECKELLLPQHWTRHLKAKHGIHTQYSPPPPPQNLGDQQKRAKHGNNYKLTWKKPQAPPILVKCPQCLKMIKKRLFNAHKNSHDPQFVCEVCGHKSISSHGLDSHKLIHSNELPYHCGHCPYRGRNKDLLAIHMRTHTKDYRYKCAQCNTHYLTKSNLNRHMRTHQQKSRDFPCDSCDKSYFSKLELERHIEHKHLGIKRHVCNICGCAYGAKSMLRKHELRVHKRPKINPHRARATYIKVQEDERRKQLANMDELY